MTIDVISPGIRDGEVEKSVDSELATIALLGAIFNRRLMTSQSFNPDDADTLVTLVLG